MTNDAKPSMEASVFWKIGEAAERAGLSVRAVHHYEATGLLTPARTSLGHRRYSRQHVSRLRRIANLRRLGLSLEEIRSCLKGERLTPRRLLELRAAAIRERVAELEQTASQLEAVLLTEAASGDDGVFDLLTAVDALAACEERLEPEQYQAWTRSRRELGPSGLAERERAFAELVAALRVEMERGTEPSQEPMLGLARRWEALAQETYLHDDVLRCNVAAAIAMVPGLAQRLGCDRALLRYVGQAQASLDPCDGHRARGRG
jgi:DNA-binding transcriptional MerR regulator